MDTDPILRTVPGGLAGFAGVAARRRPRRGRPHDVITDGDLALLLGLVAAEEVVLVPVGRGCGGLLANDVTATVATQLGVSAPTVRRRARRSLEALRVARSVLTACA